EENPGNPNRRIAPAHVPCREIKSSQHPLINHVESVLALDTRSHSVRRVLFLERFEIALEVEIEFALPQLFIGLVEYLDQLTRRQHVYRLKRINRRMSAGDLARPTFFSIRRPQSNPV